MRLCGRDRVTCKISISIHPSRVGWDSHGIQVRCRDRDFNPPIPCGMGRCRFKEDTTMTRISIHPSRVGWDVYHITYKEEESVYFNPPIPCGMGRDCSAGHLDTVGISIHPSRVGWDNTFRHSVYRLPIFQSTHPVWDGTS